MLNSGWICFNLAKCIVCRGVFLRLFDLCAGTLLTFTLNSHIKREIAEAAECTVGNVEYALKKLIAAHIIIRVAKGTYILNPFVLGRGSWERIHSMRVGIEESPIKPKEKPATTD